MNVLILLACAFVCRGADPIEDDLARAVAALPAAPAAARPAVDWLVDRPKRGAGVYRGAHPHEVVLDNGLIRRTFRVAPNLATIALDDLMTGASRLRGVKPEARVTLDGSPRDVGGLTGQPGYAYLDPAWLADMKADPAAFRVRGFRIVPVAKRLEWKRVRHAGEATWPPPGTGLVFELEDPRGSGVRIDVHYEMYDGIPLLAKWFVLRNDGRTEVRLDRFESEILAVVEHESSVEPRERWDLPDMHVETDHAFHGMDTGGANRAVRWLPDPQYATQVNYRRETPNLLVCRPAWGPDAAVQPGASFRSFTTFVLVHDSTERERKGLAQRRMYRTIAPWVTENPILMHVRRADPDAVRLAIDQCAEVGFEMVIMTFGSGFSMERLDDAYIDEIKGLVDHAHKKGIELGGYSLLASRRISDEHDAINPKTGRPGGAIFGNSPCLESAWGREYFRKLQTFIERTGIDILEHDGSYPGDVCASTSHPGHRGLHDSQWNQWQRIARFYEWCRARGTYLNVPDWYFLRGSTKVAMGYRETNWSLPRARQIIHARQNMYDGTWLKTPSMGWMFVPLVQYHGGGAAATLEPLKDHLPEYEQHLANCFAWGVQACYRGPRLFDSPETKAVVKRWVDFFRRHRRILESDVIHLRRADGRDLDGILHVDPDGDMCGMLVVWNPLPHEVTRTWRLPLYYTGLDTTATLAERGVRPRKMSLGRDYTVEIELTVPARGVTWYTVRP